MSKFRNTSVLGGHWIYRSCLQILLKIPGYSLFGDCENRETNYLKIRDLLSIALFNILGTHYLIHLRKSCQRNNSNNKKNLHRAQY